MINKDNNKKYTYQNSDNIVVAPENFNTTGSKKFLNIEYNHCITNNLFFMIILYFISTYILNHHLVNLMDTLKNTFIFDFSFIYLANVLLGVLLSLFLLFYKPFHSIRLGKEGDVPDYSYFTWYSLIFTASVSFIFMYNSIYEPLVLRNTPLFPNSDNSLAKSIATIHYNWSIFGWSSVSIVSLSLAYYSYNKSLPLLPRSLFYPLLKNKIFGKIGNFIDAASIAIALFVLTTSLEITIEQLDAGFSVLFGLFTPVYFKVVILIFLTSLGVFFLLTSFKSTIRVLALFTIIFSFFFLLLINNLVPHSSVVNNSINSLYLFVSNIFSATYILTTDRSGFLSGWTFFYWSWWSSWAIFISLFIAAISKGRTFREFIIGTILVPSVFSMLWFNVLSSASFHIFDSIPQSVYTILKKPTYSMFEFNNFVLNNFYFSFLLNFFIIFLVCMYFISSNNAGVIIISSILSKDATKKNRKNSYLVILVFQFLLVTFFIFFKKIDLIPYMKTSFIILGFFLSIVFFITSLLFIYQLFKDKKNILK